MVLAKKGINFFGEFKTICILELYYILTRWVQLLKIKNFQ